jgi:hypothetical protein
MRGGEAMAERLSMVATPDDFVPERHTREQFESLR